jgi:hypothetical protein
VVGGVVGGGVAGPQQTSQRLAAAVAAVQVGQQRVEPEGVLVGAGRALLAVGVGKQQGGVEVQDRPPGWPGPCTPGTRAGVRAGGPQRSQAVLVLQGDGFQRSPGGWDRGHWPKQAVAASQQPQVTEAVAAIGEHDDQITQDLGWLVSAGAALALPVEAGRQPLQRPGQPKPVGQLCQQAHPGMADELVIGNNDGKRRLGRLHCALLGWWTDLRQAGSSQPRRVCS